MLPCMSWDTRQVPLTLAIRGLCVAACIFATLSKASAQDERAYDPSSTNWDGLSDLIALAGEIGITIDTPEELDLETLTVRDAPLVLYPSEPLPARPLTRHLRAGGRLAVADDFGEGDSFFRVFSIERSAPNDEDQSRRLRGSSGLLVARASMRHPLSEGVSHLVTNHPQVLSHEELDSVFAFGAAPSLRGPVLTGAVQEGRLVVMSDPSIVINNMLQYGGNRRFAANLLRYLAGDDGRVLVVTPQTVLRSDSIESRADALRYANRTLDELDAEKVPPLVWLSSAFTILALCLVFLWASVPRRSPYGREAIPMERGGGGLNARVDYARRNPHHRAHACMTYRFELTQALLELLGTDTTGTSELVAAARRDQRLRADEVLELGSLLAFLDELSARIDRPPSTPKVSASRLRRVVETGERLLQRLDPADAPTRR